MARKTPPRSVRKFHRAWAVRHAKLLNRLLRIDAAYNRKLARAGLSHEYMRSLGRAGFLTLHPRLQEEYHGN